jgi:lipopolysaccharide/colanic/teichoic acid biosynthesis glycosyltransferase
VKVHQINSATAGGRAALEKKYLEEFVARYDWKRIRRIRAGRRTRFLVDRSLLITQVKGYRLIKRVMDICLTLVLMLLLLPIVILVALAIKLSDGGRVLFWQNRVGLQGRTFRCPKFRSMVPDAETRIVSIVDRNHHGDSITFKIKRDPRVTWVGRILRRFSIDELPQLWCVLSGEMSLVGPRPALPREVKHYRVGQRRRLEVKPGLTCIWQVSGRADLSFTEQFVLDVDYIENQNMILDIKLLMMTVPAVLTGRGAY